MNTRLIEPDLGRISGGLRFNAELAAASAGRITRVSAPGAWPDPSPAALRELRTLVAQCQSAFGRTQPVLLDGLVASSITPPLTGPTVVLLHALAQRPEDRAAEARTLRAADAVITPSAFAAEQVRSRYGILAEVARPGVRSTAGACSTPGVRSTPPPTGHTADTGPLHLICVGAVEANKNQLFLTRVLAELVDRGHTDWRCTLAGPITDPDYAERVRAAGGERVDILGEIDETGVETLYGHADLLLLPSTAETFGLVVQEAAVAGVPAFVTAGTGAEESLVAGRALPLEVTSWADALEQWVSDARLRRELAASARERARTAVHGWDETARIVITVLDRLS